MEPVRLVAGDFATVVVQLTDPQGRFVASEGSAHLEIDTHALAEPSLALRAGQALWLPLQDGRAIFPCVGLELPLEIDVYAKSHRVPRRELRSPSRPGETLEVWLPIGERQLTALIRAVGLGRCSPGARRARARFRRGCVRAAAGPGAFPRRRSRGACPPRRRHRGRIDRGFPAL